MEIHEITKTKEYAEAKEKIRDWKQRLESADKEETLRIRDEQKEFFSKMSKEFPELYKVFAVSSKSIREKIYQNLTGKEIIID